mmetsp:Transcript_31895/g.80878  ORF Transcript_31895/g.80878 Transcript_31895/m.80878 type:complete len:167 (+) Transcript_31895:109-609(+)
MQSFDPRRSLKACSGSLMDCRLTWLLLAALLALCGPSEAAAAAIGTRLVRRGGVSLRLGESPSEVTGPCPPPQKCNCWCHCPETQYGEPPPPGIPPEILAAATVPDVKAASALNPATALAQLREVKDGPADPPCSGPECTVPKGCAPPMPCNCYCQCRHPAPPAQR